MQVQSEFDQIDFIPNYREVDHFQRYLVYLRALLHFQESTYFWSLC